MKTVSNIICFIELYLVQFSIYKQRAKKIVFLILWKSMLLNFDVKELLHNIYCLDLSDAVFICLISLIFWCMVSNFSFKTFWKIINAVIVIVSLFLIVYTTIIRTSEIRSISLVPFISFVKAKVQPELYRSMLFNCLMFIPFSLGLAGILPEKIKIGRRVGIVIITGLALSICIETLQYIFSLGNTETDDVIMNTLGSFIAAIALLIQDKLKDKIQIKSHRSRENE